MERDEASAIQDYRRDEECAGSVKERGTMPGTPWRRYGGSIVLALVLALLGCAGDEERNLTGTWTGTIQNNIAGVGTILFTFSQSGSKVTGTWQSTFAESANNNGGTLSGTVGDPSIALVLTTTRTQACSYTVAANRDDEDHFTGTYVAFDCTRTESGSLDIARQ